MLCCNRKALEIINVISLTRYGFASIRLWDKTKTLIAATIGMDESNTVSVPMLEKMLPTVRRQASVMWYPSSIKLNPYWSRSQPNAAATMKIVREIVNVKNWLDMMSYNLFIGIVPYYAAHCILQQEAIHGMVTL